MCWTRMRCFFFFFFLHSAWRWRWHCGIFSHLFLLLLALCARGVLYRRTFAVLCNAILVWPSLFFFFCMHVCTIGTHTVDWPIGHCFPAVHMLPTIEPVMSDDSDTRLQSNPASACILQFSTGPTQLPASMSLHFPTFLTCEPQPHSR